MQHFDFSTSFILECFAEKAFAVHCQIYCIKFNFFIKNVLGCARALREWATRCRAAHFEGLARWNKCKDLHAERMSYESLSAEFIYSCRTFVQSINSSLMTCRARTIRRWAGKGLNDQSVKLLFIKALSRLLEKNCELTTRYASMREKIRDAPRELSWLHQSAMIVKMCVTLISWWLCCDLLCFYIQDFIHERNYFIKVDT